jgi:hypothetical protein
MNNQDPQFTTKLQAWVNTPDSQKDWDEGALLLLQLSGNRIMYHNISINPKGKAEFIKGQLQKYLNFRLLKLTKDQVNEMQSEVDEIVKKVIKPASESNTGGANKSDEFADFKAGKRPDHDDLPEEIQALYVENLDIVHRMRELHLKLRSLSLETATCPDSERYPFLKEIIALDKKRVQNWDIYDHFIPGTPVTVEEPAPEKDDSIKSEPTSDQSDIATVPEASAEGQESAEHGPAEAKPKKEKTTAKRTTKKTAKK